MEKLAVYPGSFDPPTLGHLDLVQRALSLFDRIVVAVAVNAGKNPLFSTAERLDMLRQSLIGFDRVEVDNFDGLLVDYARRRQAAAILRGLRATADFEYEFQMALVNRHLNPDIQSVFLMTDFRWHYISSTIVKEAAFHHADVSAMVPAVVAERLAAKFAR